MAANAVAAATDIGSARSCTRCRPMRSEYRLSDREAVNQRVACRRGERQHAGHESSIDASFPPARREHDCKSGRHEH